MFDGVWLSHVCARGDWAVSWKVMLVPGAVVVGSGVGPVLVVLIPGTEVVDDSPIVVVPRPEVFGAIPETALLVALVTDSIPVVTGVGVAGLLPVVGA